MAAIATVRNRSLWQEYRETRDAALRNRLVLENLGLVYRIVNRYASLAPDAYEDMVQEGCLALIHAVERFRPEYGLRFSTYAYPVISGIVRNFLRDRRRQTGKLRPVGEAAEATFEQGETLVSPEDLEALAAEGAGDFTDRVVDRVLTDSLLDRLPPVERDMLRQVFYEDLSQREVADKLARSASRISRVMRRALLRLRSLLLEVQQEENRLTVTGERRKRSIQALVDEETGLFGPRYLHQCLAGAIRQADVYRAPVTVALLRPRPELNHTLSLSSLAERIYRRVRAMDHVFRVGRRELALVFPLPADQTARVCNRVVANGAGVEAIYALATYPEEARSPSELLETARRKFEG